MLRYIKAVAPENESVTGKRPQSPVSPKTKQPHVYSFETPGGDACYDIGVAFFTKTFMTAGASLAEELYPISPEHRMCFYTFFICIPGPSECTFVFSHE